MLVYSPEKFLPNSALNVRVIGAMKMVDDGETDTKLVAVHADDFRLEHIKELKDLPLSFLVNLEAFFANYKNFKRVGITKVEGFESKEW
ncbi:inorganic pyrophosphatase, partial [Mycoplasmopsis synoviae]